jgi:hypothetical protein
MRAAKYLSICALLFTGIFGLPQPDTSATPVEKAPIAVNSAAAAKTPAQRGKVSQVTKKNPQLARFYNAAKFAEKKYKWGETSTRVLALQGHIGALRTSTYDLQTRQKHLDWLTFFGASTDHVPAPPLPAPGETPGISRRCPQYEPIAIAVGWPAEQVPKLSYVMWRESRCNPLVHADISDGYIFRNDDSYGLMQVNMKAHRSWVGPIVDWDFNRLFDPYVNLSVGLRLWHMSGGWRPWGV